MNCRIKTVEAYDSVEKPLSDVTNAALNDTPVDDEFTELVLSSPTADISNLESSQLTPNDNTEALKQAIVVSCKKIFTTAEKAVRDNPRIRKVVILEHPERFVTPEIDPVGFKPQLVRYANHVFGQLWFISPHKDKVVIGNHNLNLTQILKNVIPQPTKPRNQPSSSYHDSCPQTLYQRRQKTTIISSPQFSVPLHNRFEILGN